MKRLLILLTIMLLLAACGAGETPATPTAGAGEVETPATPMAEPTASSGELVQAAVGRDESPEVSSASVGELAQGNNRFAFDFYHQVAGQSMENLIYSPYSISLAFSMVYAGADGETAEQMAEVFRYLPQEVQHPAYNTLDQQIAVAGEADYLPEGAEPFRLNVANAVWAQDGYPFREAYLELLARQYGAGVWTVDFAQDLDAALEAINDWTSDATEGRIPELAPPLSVTPQTRLVLANAIYFKASWLFAFEEARTADGAFTLLDGSRVTVPLMHQDTARVSYVEGDGYQAVWLPYAGGTIDMLVVLPAEGEFEVVEAQLDGELLAAMQDRAEVRDVDLTLPRFEFDTTLQLVELLQEMGLTIPFSSEADFSGIVESGLFIADAVHKGTITVDEKGTEAAAVTGVAMEESAYPGAEVSVTRPFLFAIIERESGTILFLGRVLNPAG
jgi:serpin B